jgi:hypothetical protein
MGLSTATGGLHKDLSVNLTFSLWSHRVILSTYWCWYWKISVSVTSILKVLTYIITARHFRLTAIQMIMSVSTFKTDIILYVSICAFQIYKIIVICWHWYTYRSESEMTSCDNICQDLQNGCHTDRYFPVSASVCW